MPTRVAREHRPAMRFLMSIALFGALAVGGFIFRDYIGGSPADLKVGDCFDVPTTAEETVDDVQHHPCTESHTAEVILIQSHPAAESAAIPSDTALFDWLRKTCVSGLMGYVGQDTALYDVGAFYPTESDWDKGDREVTCYVTMLDGSAVTASLKR